MQIKVEVLYKVKYLGEISFFSYRWIILGSDVKDNFKFSYIKKTFINKLRNSA